MGLKLASEMSPYTWKGFAETANRGIYSFVETPLGLRSSIDATLLKAMYPPSYIRNACHHLGGRLFSSASLILGDILSGMCPRGADSEVDFNGHFRIRADSTIEIDEFDCLLTPLTGRLDV